VAVNVFFRELPEASYPSKDLYGNADPVAAARALEACAAAAKDLSSLPRDHRVFYGGIAAARLLRDLRIEEEVGAMVAPAAAAAAAGAAAAVAATKAAAVDEVAFWQSCRAELRGGSTYPAAAIASVATAARVGDPYSLAWATLRVSSWWDAAKGVAVGAAAVCAVRAALSWDRPR
jgi:hypothetical protein